MSAKHRARVLLQKLGVDVIRYPDHHAAHRTVESIAHLGADIVLDVGANDGGYGRDLRAFGYTGTILSLEPLSEPFERLSRHIASDSSWTAVQCAAGATDDEITINVASNGEASSSALEMLDAHRTAAPGATYRTTETVQQRRLDGLWDELGLSARRPFLKVDVQGYESFVLDGSPKLLSDRVVGVQLELSMVPLYEGGLTLRAAIDRMDDLGFRLAHFFPGWTDPACGELLQADGIFVRGTGAVAP